MAVGQREPFLANVLILYPLKIPENHRFSGVFRAYKMRPLAIVGTPLLFYKVKGVRTS